ncbi:ParB/RepB/Spo0J family partition protein [Roseospira visakhapatnamensis]|uniref:ParB family chromosome partitioning protein n=1 Tax=Roseospira visakhapatnamensis TaxID=390880 RepID=A0A7W6WB09_9PROT|nr:ParB N-terminal domain-containing protein [Roseospira visakhapatnamensis]MBB4267800.1 ParB family chromosome partitioning protein [Roseospira visakhapatnamensis]
MTGAKRDHSAQGERRTVPAAAVHVGDRLRQVDRDWVAALAESMRQVGVMEPPVVRLRSKSDVDGWDLVAGAHRFAALVDDLGWTEIPVVVVKLDDLAARLVEIDENLMRRELEPLDRAVFLAERKAVYEAMHPEAKEHAAGGKGKAAAAKIAAADAKPAIGFAREACERIGLSERTIFRAVQVANGLAPQVRAQLQRFRHWKEGELYALSKLPHSDQAAVVEALLADDAAEAPPDLGAALRAHGREGPQAAADDDGGLGKLLSAWQRANGAARKSFLGHLRETGALKGRANPGGDDAS